MTAHEIHVRSEDGAVELARHLNGPRSHPVVVVSVPAGRDDPIIDVAEILDEVGDLARVYVIHSGEESWAFGREMTEGTQVYGGAGRVYPVGTEWVHELRRSPLRLAFGKAQAQWATRMLISDALAAANGAGLLERESASAARPVEGEVKGVLSGRAIVRTTLGIAYVAEELLLPGVPIDRLLHRGQQVVGDRNEDKRLDLRGMLLSPAEALAAYDVGDVVLARVDEVSSGSAILALHPGLTVEVARHQVTSNALDDLTTLLSVGEIVRVRVVATGPAWEVELYDVDDDEPVVPAAALLPGGPPWLVEETTPVADVPAPVEPAELLTAPPEPAAPQPAALPPAPEVAPEPPPAPRTTPSPLLLDPRRRGQPKPGPVRPATPRPSPPPPTGAPSATPPEVARLQGELTRARQHAAHLEQVRTGLLQERELLDRQSNEDRRRIERLEDEVRDLKRRLRETRTKKGASVGPDERAADWFVDDEDQFRYDVQHAWVRRIPAAEKAHLPLAPYELGPRFLPSLRKLHGIDPQKVADVVVDVLTDRAHQMPGRDLHQLRTGQGGDDAPVRREEDGASCWRVALQVNTPAARRLHFWRLPGGGVELCRVVTHDDVDP